MPEGTGGGVGDARRRLPRVVQHDRQLAVRHRERRIQRDGLPQQRHRSVGLSRVIGPERLGVLPQRRERARGHLLERVARADRLERLTYALAQSLGQPVHGVDDGAVVLGILAQGDERGAVRRGDELGRQHVAAPHRIDLAAHHGLRALALSELLRDRAVERRVGVAPHAAECLAQRGGVEQADRRRLGQVHAQRFGERRTEGRVLSAVLEAREHQTVPLRQHAGRDQRAHRADPEQPHRHVARGAEPE